MRNEIKAYMSGKPNYDVRTALHVTKIGRDYVHMISLYEGSKPEKMGIEEFFNEFIKG